MSGLRVACRLQRPAFTLDVDFQVAGRGLTALFGPSGSGKTTLLRCLAGLERPEQGQVFVNGECWQDSAQARFLLAHQRRVGYVFQQGGLLSHLTVRGNLDYALRRRTKAVTSPSLVEVVAWARIAHLLTHLPAELSGGETSRVALARALLTAPRLMLLDEPLAALDAPARAELLPYLERLPRELAVPVVYVTHAQEEVARLADHLVYLQDGKLLVAGKTQDLLARLDLPLAQGDEAGVVVQAQVAEHDETYQLSLLDFPGGRLSVVKVDLPVGASVRVRILARDVSLSLDHHERSSILNILPATIVEISEDRPAQVLVKLEAGGVPLLARITRKSLVLMGLRLRVGQPLYAQVKTVALLS